MVFQHVIYKKKEFEKENGLPLELLKLFRQLRQNDITVLGIDSQRIDDFMKREGVLPEDTLLLAATDETLAQANDLSIATIGCQNPDFPEEELYQTDFLVEGFEEVDYYFLERVYQRKHGIPWRVIETKRCYLREMTLDDLDDLYEMYEDAAITKYMEPLYERKKEEEYTRAYIANMYHFYGYGMWLVKDEATDTLIGRAGLNNLEIDGENFLEMGYAIKVPCQRKGYATEVCEAIIAYAKGAGLGYEKLHCFVQEENEASLALLHRLGFTYCRKLWRNGREMLLYELLLGD